MFRKRIIFGVLLVVWGVVVLLNSLGQGYHIGRVIGDFWPLLLIALGVDIILDRRDLDGKFFGLILIFLGTVLIGMNLDWFSRSFGWKVFWGGLLVFLGVKVLAGTRIGYPSKENKTTLDNNAS